jgi:hypothetical protein
MVTNYKSSIPPQSTAGGRVGGGSFSIFPLARQSRVARRSLSKRNPQECNTNQEIDEEAMPLKPQVQQNGLGEHTTIGSC